MNQELVITLGQETVKMVLMVAAPMLLFGMVVGIAVAVLQSATQIQEMTLTFVPKIIAVLLALLFFLPWMMNSLLDFTRNLLLNIPLYVR